MDVCPSGLRSDGYIPMLFKIRSLSNPTTKKKEAAHTIRGTPAAAHAWDMASCYEPKI